MGQEEIRKEIKKFLETSRKLMYNSPKPMGHNESSPEREVCSNRGLLKKIEKSQINNPTLHLQELEDQQQRKPRASRRKKMIKIREELNDIETKKQFKGSTNPGADSLKTRTKLTNI